MKRSIALPLIILAALIAVFVTVYVSGNRSERAVSNYDECVAAGFPVLESYPERCRTDDGRMFTRETASGEEGEAQAPVRNVTPSANTTVSSPLTVTGQARGTWFFEASFPVKLVDSAGKVLAQGPAQAEGEWMTEDYVPFRAELAFTPPATATAGELVLEKDNPSGLPEHAGEIRIPVRIAARSVGTPAATAGCYVGGCSGQICSDEKDVASTCEFRPEYACYKQPFAKCERQADGQCGWTENAELGSCLRNSQGEAAF